ncbi:DUF4145 domain-containing protein [Sphingobium yanoikuyae]|jgi:Domain of unknown function (DUF4145)|uniref:DUF4145 domain-containing protein n=1 Tax=Sphingobium yanoikuyae TaxID=13690 RepID=UPI003B9173AD
MAIFVTKCPHCSADKMTFHIQALEQRLGEYDGNAFSSCPSCRNPICAWIKRGTSARLSINSLSGWMGNIEDAGWRISILWPPAQASVAPEDVPTSISRNFVQAEEARKRQHWESAGMTYRRCLELAMKDRAPDLSGSLARRIDKLAEAGGLTSDVAEWAHSIREIGNEAAHDEHEPNPDDIEDLAAFTKIVLEYLYTMPEKVRRRSGQGHTNGGQV